MIYFVLLFSCILVVLISKENTKLQRLYAIVFIVFMFLIVAARDVTVGVDSEQYVYKLTIEREIDYLSYEILYELSVVFINWLGGTTLQLFAYFAVLTYSIYAISILRYSANPILSVLVFMVSFAHFFPETMNMLRQSVAIVSLLLSYIMFAEKKYGLVLLFFIIAIGFHMSSLIALPFYLICKYNFSKKTIILTLISTFIAGFVSSQFITIESFLPNLSFGAEILATGLDKFANYADSTRIINAYGLLTILPPFNLLCFLLIPNDTDSKRYRYLFNFYLWGVIIANLALGSLPYGMRYVYIFIIVESILFAEKFKQKKILKAYMAFMVIMFIIYLITLSGRNDLNMIIPYHINPEIL